MLQPLCPMLRLTARILAYMPYNQAYTPYSWPLDHMITAYALRTVL